MKGEEGWQEAQKANAPGESTAGENLVVEEAGVQAVSL